MKNQFRPIAFLVSFSVLAFTGCSSDDDSLEPVEPPVANELSGDLDENLTLDPEVEYKLTGTFQVQAGATLTIPAGTRIIASVDPDAFIAINKGAEIQVNGTASNPVVMTSPNGNPGDWGGLLLLGEATTTEGVDAIAEVGGLIYGGTDDQDNSGSIEYLVIVGAGAQINADSQYNGLTLYSVGSGTTIENVAILNGADDGVEFFGGTVSATNLYLENNEDDAVDWTEGYNGTVTNTYVNHSIEGFSTAVEADGINGNPQLVNFTAISSTGGTALQFKKESGATITNLYLEGYETTVDMANDGPLANVQIEGEDASPSKAYDAGTQVDISTWSWIEGI